ncbi:MAG: AAA family ATPase, partial [Candidatus Aminicenantes bacterium]|nr:AAA family ATPase [Candidatus Aminicenantes bacterium]NIO84419.1 AAA family ATPase [Candidatus Aminicenantes bacterium]NIQ70361.1 AAA family ATPase [Candidatus Aminicenantes bacterium]
MILLFLGPPASGKGTQAELVAKELKLQYFEAGDVLREISEEKNPLAQKIDQIMHQEGKLLPDEIMNQVVKQWLAAREVDKGIVFDGYPRKLSQYNAFQRMLTERNIKIDKAIFLKVSQNVSIRRISSRRVCSQCDNE